MIVAVVAALIGALLLFPKLRGKVVPQIKRAASDVWAVLRTPKKALQLFGGALVGNLAGAAVLGLCLLAFGQHLAFAELLVVQLGAGVLASLAPVPGGVGVQGAALTGALTGFGVASAPALAAVFLYRGVTFVLPPIVGFFTLRWLRKTRVRLSALRSRVTSAVETMRRWFVRDRPDGAPHRRATDVVRMVVTFGLLALLALHADHPTRPERAVATFFHTLPDGAADVLRGTYSVVSLWALLILVAALVLLRRWRLGRDVLVAGAVTWLLGRALAYLVHQTDLAHAFSLAFGTNSTPRFPLVRVAVAVSAIAVAGPYLTRPVRHAWARPWSCCSRSPRCTWGGASPPICSARSCSAGASPPACTSPSARPSGGPRCARWARPFAALQLEASNVRMVPDQPVGRAIFLASRGDQDLRVIAIGRDEADTQFLARLSRYLAFRDSPPAPLPTRRQQVEFEAFVMLTAAGARPRAERLGRRRPDRSGRRARRAAPSRHAARRAGALHRERPAPRRLLGSASSPACGTGRARLPRRRPCPR